MCSTWWRKLAKNPPCLAKRESSSRRGNENCRDSKTDPYSLLVTPFLRRENFILMLKAIFAASLLVVFTCDLRAEAIPAGWEKLRWGMKAADIIKAYPAAKPMAKPESRGPFGERSYTAKLSMPGVTIAGVQFTAYFLMDETDSLAAVQLWKDFPADAEARQAYDTLKEYLNKKYFPRTKEEDLSDSVVSPGSTRADWNSANANINLIFLSIRDIVCKTSLCYVKP